ncbi:TPA: fimbrial protein [Aeromonas hydrophila]
MKGVVKQTVAGLGPLQSRALLVGLLLVLPAPFPAAAGTLNFTVTATVVEPTCSVVPESANQTIVMPDIDAAELNSVGKTSPTLFSIKLEKCSGVASAKLMFSSNTADGLGQFYPNGERRGFLLAFTDKSGVRIKLDNEVVMPLEQGNNTLQFGVQATRDDNQALVSGDFTAQATATIAYL